MADIAVAAHVEGMDIPTDIVQSIYALLEKMLMDKINRPIANDQADELKDACEKIIKIYVENLKAIDCRMDWKSDLNRSAYVYLYFVIHACLVYDVSSKEVQAIVPRDLSTRKTINVCSVGGGPGSDIAGMMFFLNRFAPASTLKVTVCDLYPDWQHTWKVISSKLPQNLRQQSEVVYLKFDMLTFPPPVDVIDAVQNTDILMFVKSLSTVDSAMSQANSRLRSTLETVLAHSKVGVVVILIDNASVKNEEFLQLAQDAAGLQVVRQTVSLKSETRIPRTTSNFVKACMKRLQPHGPTRQLDVYIAIFKKNLELDSAIENQYIRFDDAFAKYFPQQPEYDGTIYFIYDRKRLQRRFEVPEEDEETPDYEDDGNHTPTYNRTSRHRPKCPAPRLSKPQRPKRKPDIHGKKEGKIKQSLVKTACAPYAYFLN